MNRGRHAADDGSFNKSAGMAAGRGAVLLAVAVLLGIVLLSATDDGPTGVSAGPSATEPADRPTTTSTTSFVTPTTIVPARPAAEVKVLTLNGTDVKGAAKAANDLVKTGGFNVLAPADAAAAAKGSPSTAVFFTATYEQEAAAVAAALGVAGATVLPVPDPPPAADLRGANVVVLVGADLAGRLVTPASSTTTTTRAGAAAASTTTTTRA